MVLSSNPKQRNCPRNKFLSYELQFAINTERRRASDEGYSGWQIDNTRIRCRPHIDSC